MSGTNHVFFFKFLSNIMNNQLFLTLYFQWFLNSFSSQKCLETYFIAMYSFVLQNIYISSLLAVQIVTIIKRNEKLLIFVALFSVYVQSISIFWHSVISICSYSHGPFLGGLLKWISSAWKLRLDLWNSVYRFLYWFLITLTYCN